MFAVAALAAAAAGACSGGGGDDLASTTAPSPEATTTTAAPGAEVAHPTVEGPVEGGRYGVPYNPMPEGLADEYGYTEEEWFVSGDATSYDLRGEMAADGEWVAAPADTAPYTTRIIVRRPTDPAAFNGTVVVEWLNDSVGRNSDPDFGSLYPVLLGEGFAYVGVSAQAPGVEGGGIVIDIPGVPPVALAPLREWDPQRYGSLSHPGDAYSYDIFSQVAQLVRRPGDVDPLGGVTVDHVIAVGESQSSGRIATYANAIEPLTGIYDGFFIHGRSDGASPINDDPSLFAPEPTYLRSDADAPMLQFETETDLISLGNIDARQDDSETLVTWEVAGTAHADRSYVDYGVASAQLWIEGVHNDPTEPCGAINDGPQPDVTRAAFVALYDWVVDGRPPRTAPRIETAGGDIVRDEYGNALGGVRTPPVDAPVSSLTGITPAENLFCLLFGAAVPLTDAQLAGLYTDHADYVAQVTASADAAVEAGFLLPADRDTFVAAAEAADVP